MSKWYKCKARDMSIWKPDGRIVTFHIGGEDEDSVRSHLIGKGFINIEYITENPNFEDTLK